MSRTDLPTHGWLRRAVTHPDFAARLAPLATGERELVLDHSAEASHAFLAALVCEAAAEWFAVLEILARSENCAVHGGIIDLFAWQAA